jgi:hypothetical protein
MQTHRPMGNFYEVRFSDDLTCYYIYIIKFYIDLFRHLKVYKGELANRHKKHGDLISIFLIVQNKARGNVVA